MKTRLFCIIAALFFSIGLYAQEAPVQHSQLPAEAKTFLKEHFKSKFHHGIKDVEGREITYDVFLNDDTEIEFTETGRWKSVDGKNKPVPTTFIQKQSLDYIKINYPKESVIKIERSDSGYEAKLSNGLELLFDAMGTFTKLD